MVKTKGRGRERKIQSKKSLVTKYLTYWGFPGGSVVNKKNPPANAGESGFDPWVRKIPWSSKQPIPVFFLPEISIDRGAWQATVHVTAKS